MEELAFRQVSTHMFFCPRAWPAACAGGPVLSVTRDPCACSVRPSSLAPAGPTTCGPTATLQCRARRPIAIEHTPLTLTLHPDVVPSG
jgi:hypothetical protein